MSACEICQGYQGLEVLTVNTSCLCGLRVCTTCIVNKGIAIDGSIACIRCFQFHAHNISKRSQKFNHTARQSKTVDRVVVPNVVYLMNLPEPIVCDEILKSTRFLGQYGRIEKIILHKNGTAHVTFYSIRSAELCIKCLDNYIYSGNRISALVGTTKYPEDIDMKRIANNSLTEPQLIQCRHPIFPSPFQIQSPRSVSHDHSFNFGQQQTSSSSAAASRNYHVNTTNDNDDFVIRQTGRNDTPRPLVFGTGGLFHSMWVDQEKPPTPTNDAFVPFWGTINGGPVNANNNHFSAAPSNNNPMPTDKKAKMMSVESSRDSEKEFGISPRGMTELSFDAPPASSILGDWTFSPCKDMMRAVHAPTFTPTHFMEQQKQPSYSSSSMCASPPRPATYNSYYSDSNSMPTQHITTMSPSRKQEAQIDDSFCFRDFDFHLN